MSRRFVSQLAHQESVNEIFLASEKQLRPNRSGNLYLQVELSDRSGSIGARMWNASEQDFRAFENGDYVVICSTVTTRWVWSVSTLFANPFTFMIPNLPAVRSKSTS